MNHNDVLRSLRYMLKVNDAKMAEIIALSGLEVNPVVLATYLKKEDEAGFVRCPERVMAHFLDGLVIHRRGKDDSRTPQPVELPVTNNTILKKLRVASSSRKKTFTRSSRRSISRCPSLNSAHCSARSAMTTTVRAATSCCATSSRA